jgi:hypothetical protein
MRGVCCAGGDSFGGSQLARCVCRNGGSRNRRSGFQSAFRRKEGKIQSSRLRPAPQCDNLRIATGKEKIPGEQSRSAKARHSRSNPVLKVIDSVASRSKPQW